MTALPTARPLGTRSARGWPGTTLLVVLVVVALNAVYGGIGLVVDGMGMPAEWLENLPVDSWVLPGVALLVTVALPQAVAAGLAWRRHPRAALAGGVVGLGLVLWIAVQLLVLRRYFVLQPVIAGLGLVEMALALVWHDRRSVRRAAPGPSSGG